MHSLASVGPQPNQPASFALNMVFNGRGRPRISFETFSGPRPHTPTANRNIRARARNNPGAVVLNGRRSNLGTDAPRNLRKARLMFRDGQFAIEAGATRD